MSVSWKLTFICDLKLAGTELFTVAIHHGGRFYSNGGMNKVYKGGDMLYVDHIDPVRLDIAGFNYWAFDLGYCHGSISYWFRIPGSEEGTGYLPVVTDADAMDIVQFIPRSSRVLDIYIVCLTPKRTFSEFELERMDEDPDHSSFFGHLIEDLPLTDEEDTGEQEDAANLDELFKEWGLPKTTMGSCGMGNGVVDVVGGSIKADGSSRGANGPRKRTTGIQIREPSDGPRASVPISNVTIDKGKGKEKVVEAAQKRKVGRPKKRSYNTRSGGESSRPVQEEAFSS